MNLHLTDTIPDIAMLAALIADKSRANMLSALLGGVAMSASELAEHARVTPQTASAHLAKLVHGNLVSVTKSGRHRYFCLSNAQVADILEGMALIAPAGRGRSLNHSLEIRALRRARICYDHLAGRLGVMLTQALIDRKFVQAQNDIYELTKRGESWLEAFGINCQILKTKRRKFAVPCLDWTERKPHIAGALGAEMMQRLLELEWIKRIHGSRAVAITGLGYPHLKTEFGLEVA